MICKRFARREFPGLLDLAEVRAVDVLHEEVAEGLRVGGRGSRVEGGDRGRLNLAEVVNGDDVRMAQFGERAGFAAEAAGEIQVAAGARCEDFQGDEAIERRLARLVNRAHAALADDFEDFQLGK